MQATEMAEMAALSDAEVTTMAYVEAADGDIDLALSWAIGDLLASEERFAEALRAVSHGFVLGQLLQVAAA